MRRLVAMCGVLFLPSLLANAEPARFGLQVGDEYEIRKSYETSEQRSDGGSGSSSGHDTILERVIAVRETGLELEYDLAKDTTAEDRARQWQFPARVLKPSNGPLQLLNGGQLEERVDGWLKKAGWPREVCGRWIFTWNAFRIDCEPETVTKTLEQYDLPDDLHDGEMYKDPAALERAPLRMKSVAGGTTFQVKMPIDPAAVRQARAESDVAVGQIMRKPVTLEAALRTRSAEQVSGSILVIFDVDSAGRAWRRVSVTTVEIRTPDGVVEKRTGKETVERRLRSRPRP